MKKKVENKVQGLCFRCEHRALALEKKSQPRCECGMRTVQMVGCYMYKPCKPVITAVINYGFNKKRPRFAGWLLSARERGVELFDGQLATLDITKTKAVLLWEKKVTKKK